MATNVIVDVNEYEDIKERYNALRDSIENSSNEFFEEVKKMCTTSKIVEGVTAKNLGIYCENVINTLKGELEDILKSAVGIEEDSNLSTYVFKIKSTDKIKWETL